ncbi:hypothetical protein FACS189488_00490 [Betaproteobacteria bacterium]|nr:hypothetical protein FACS189488_00490 [Betaproteobacteria bacterium]
MIHSMTGYATRSCEADGLTLHLELRSVNSRYLDLGFRIVDDLRQAEPALREQISARLSRGKVECRLSLQTGAAQSVAAGELALDTGVLEQLARAQAQVFTHFPAARPLAVADLLRWPGVLTDDSAVFGPVFERLQPLIAGLACNALDDFIASRAREGEKLAAMILDRVARMRELAAIVAPRMPVIVAEYRERLTRKLHEVLSSADEERIIQETVLYAQRIDVAEELSRLSTHLDEIERILAGGGAVGKRLDFLTQELNREANTLASKSPATDMTAVAMELKVQIEQIREQVQNIE